MLDLVGNPEDRFSHDAAHFVQSAYCFQMIPFETPEKSEVPINVEEKNRFANVLPCKFHITLTRLCNML